MRRWRDHAQPGCVINIAKATGHVSPGIPHTAASRVGAINLSRGLRVIWAPLNIRINCIAVGVIASPGLENYPASARPSFDYNPMRCVGDMHHIAEACCYLAAPSGKFITGAVLEVAGGRQVCGECWPLGASRTTSKWRSRTGG